MRKCRSMGRAVQRRWPLLLRPMGGCLAGANCGPGSDGPLALSRFSALTTCWPGALPDAPVSEPVIEVLLFINLHHVGEFVHMTSVVRRPFLLVLINYTRGRTALARHHDERLAGSWTIAKLFNVQWARRFLNGSHYQLNCKWASVRSTLCLSPCHICALT